MFVRKSFNSDLYDDKFCELPEIGYIGSSNIQFTTLSSNPKWLTNFSLLPAIYHECMVAASR